MQVRGLQKILEVRDEDDGECWFFNSQDGMQLFVFFLRGPFHCLQLGRFMSLTASRTAGPGPGSFFRGKEMRGAIF